jgi:hypothetical protein
MHRLVLLFHYLLRMYICVAKEIKAFLMKRIRCGVQHLHRMREREIINDRAEREKKEEEEEEEEEELVC